MSVMSRGASRPHVFVKDADIYDIVMMSLAVNPLASGRRLAVRDWLKVGFSAFTRRALSKTGHVFRYVYRRWARAALEESI